MAALAAGKPIPPVIADAEKGAAKVLYGLGSVGGRQSDELAAMIYLRLALYMDPQQGLAIVTLADVYERLKQNEQAIRVYEMVPESSPLRDNSEVQIGLLLESEGKSEEALKHLEEHRRRAPAGSRSGAGARKLAALAQAVRGSRRHLHARARAVGWRAQRLVNLLFPGHLLRALEALAAGGSAISARRSSSSPISRWCSIISAIHGSTRA